MGIGRAQRVRAAFDRLSNGCDQFGWHLAPVFVHHGGFLRRQTVATGKRKRNGNQAPDVQQVAKIQVPRSTVIAAFVVHIDECFQPLSGKQPAQPHGTGIQAEARALYCNFVQ
ncbi:hypothetical protein GCM10027320_00450 [Massilia solisilvae]